MKIGIPMETMAGENRVALTPAGVAELASNGHQIYVERGAGAGSGYPDDDYRAAGAILLEQARDVWDHADMVMKVKEPQPPEYGYFREGLVLFAYLHLAAEKALAQALLERQVTAVAYETVGRGRALPLLTPMSEIAGRMAAQIGARLLEKTSGGSGILLGGAPGVPRGKVAVIGGGAVGMNAALIAAGLGARVTILERSSERIRQLNALFGGSADVLMSDAQSLSEHVSDADLAIGAVLLPGAKAPRLIDAGVVRRMRPGSVIIDVAIDQGGIFETIDRKTTYDAPTYTKFDVIHYAVANMPGAVPRTSTMALTNATLPYALRIAGQGVRLAAGSDEEIRSGVNVAGGQVLHAAVARELGRAVGALDDALSG